ncbi:MAG: exopolysaccharide Pel transporter PelG [Methylococcales bacterium]|nr:exopolysaccharide Pel transporter PelG [Methylococcales bacterium]
MAGIGFRLRNLMNDESYSGLLKAYTFAGIISSGPWILSIVGILLIGIFNTENGYTQPFVGEFQISVTYLMAFSLLLTSPLQLMFTRFISDRVYEEKEDWILPNLLGAILLVVVISGALAIILLNSVFNGSVLYRVLMLTGFVILSVIWIVVIILSGLKAHSGILLAFFVGYGITVGASLKLKVFGLEGLLGGFVVGQGVMLFMLLYLVLRSYASTRLIAFDFLRRDQIYLSLVATGFFYNLAIWVDKLLFWFNPQTSIAIIAPLRGSELYDMPIFLAYLSILPGMATFLIRMETDFAEQYQLFYHAIKEGTPLHRISQIYDDMCQVIRRGFLEIFKVQGVTVIILLALGEPLLKWVHISPNYQMLLNIDLVAVGVQVLLLAELNLLFYFDYRLDALYLCLLFALSNVLFTLLTQVMGPAFYGYGFAGAVVLNTLVGMCILSRRLDKLMYETFMLH